MTASQPTWTDEIGLLFSAPYWIPAKVRSDVADEWYGCMKSDFINLSDYDSVREWTVTIYNHLASQNMPLTTDTSQYWPAEALETFRLCVNAGWPETADSPTDWADRIPAPETRENTLRIRKDISTLSDAELNEFRARLDDRLRVSDASHDSPWQMWAYIHTNWCLHYQEAFFFWHRAYLMYFEELIGMAIPYWDWMAANASDPRSPLSGLPQAFMDETYVHPGTGQTRPNPLRFAAAKDGRSKMCVPEPDHCHGDMCWHVNRLPVFDLKKNPHFRDRDRHFRMPGLFQQQVVDALKFETFSTPQGDGVPWANIPAFDPPKKIASIRTATLISTASTNSPMTIIMAGSAMTWRTILTPHSTRSFCHTMQISTEC